MKIAKSKLIILTAFVAVLVLLTLWLFEAIKGYEAVPIKPDPFKPVAVTAISGRIEGKDYTTARNAFDSIFTMIDLQGKLILKDGSHPTPASEIDSLKLMAYESAVKTLINDADKLFPSSKWSSFPLEDYRSYASYYLNLNPQNNFYEPNLKKIIDNINDYQAALKVCRNAGAVTTVAGIQQLANNVKKYKRYPLTNDTELNSQLNSAVQKACNSVAASIERRAANLRNSIASFSTFDGFTASYNSITHDIDMFTKSYGFVSSLNSAKETLTAAYIEARQHFCH